MKYFTIISLLLNMFCGFFLHGQGEKGRFLEASSSGHSHHSDFSQVAELKGSISDENSFGTICEFYGKYLFVGAPQTIAGGEPSAGAVYVYYLNNKNQWVLTQTITTDGAFDLLSFSSIVAEKGYLFISAIGTPLGDSGGIDDQDFTGAVLVYRQSEKKIGHSGAHEWKLIQTIDKSVIPNLTVREPDGMGADFGIALDVDVVNGVLVVSAIGQDVVDPVTQQTVPHAGKAYIFYLNVLTGLWELNQSLISPNGPIEMNNFGNAIAVDDGYLMIAEGSVIDTFNPAFPNNLVYVYKRISNQWIYIQTLKSDLDPAFSIDQGFSDHFGSLISMDDGWAIISSPRESVDPIVGTPGFETGVIYFFHLNDGKWFKRQTVISDNPALFKQTGVFVCNLQGKVALVSDSFSQGPAGDNQGSLLLYHREGSRWKLFERLYNPNGVPNEFFGAGGAFIGPALINQQFQFFVAGRSFINNSVLIFQKTPFNF